MELTSADTAHLDFCAKQSRCALYLLLEHTPNKRPRIVRNVRELSETSANCQKRPRIVKNALEEGL